MKNKGFTLIELLAVITILAILALITVPIVAGIIQDSRKSTVETSAKFYIDAIEKTILSEDASGRNISNGVYTILTDGNICIIDEDKVCLPDSKVELDLDRTVPKSGTITITNQEVTSLVDVKFNDFYVSMDSSKNIVVNSEGNDTSIDGEGEKKQTYCVAYYNINQTASCDIREGENFEVYFGSDFPISLGLEVTMNDVVITDYEYVEGILTIENVTGNIEITYNDTYTITPVCELVSGTSIQAMGSEVQCGDQVFYVVKGYTDPVVLFSKYNLSLTGTIKQSSTTTDITTFSNRTYWLDNTGSLLSDYSSGTVYDKNSNIYQYLRGEGGYASYLASIGLTDFLLRPPSNDEFMDIMMFNSRITQTNYWAGYYSSNSLWTMSSSTPTQALYTAQTGVRPILVLPKSYIK